MILWLNGPYGVGKSTLAETLHTLLADSFIFDAEQVGNAIRDNMPDCLYHETFEEYPLWIETCSRLLMDISAGYDGHVLVPMALTSAGSARIFSDLQDSGVEIRHIILDAAADEIHRRILARGEEPDCWCAQYVSSALAAQKNMPCNLRLNAADAPARLAQKIINVYQL